MRKIFHPLTTPVLLALLAGFYWEFFHDPVPVAAVEFFYPLESVADEQNVIYSIAGLAAPLSSPNARAWGYRQIAENRERVRRGENPVSIFATADDSQSRARLQGINGKKFYCLLPDAPAGKTADRCLTRAEGEAAVDANRVLLQRYESLFDYDRIETRRHQGFNMTDILEYSDLYTLSFWFERERLTADDYSRIFRYFRFWENLFADASVEIGARMLILLNYNKAASLLTRLAQAKPEILLQYRREHGLFALPLEPQALLDQMLRREYATLDRIYCLRARFGVSDDCKPRSLRFPGKLGESTARLYARRISPQDCPAVVEQPVRRFERKDRWRFMLADPGNIAGNFLLLTVADQAHLCRGLQLYLLAAEANLLRNRFLEFRAGDLDANALSQLN